MYTCTPISFCAALILLQRLGKQNSVNSTSVGKVDVNFVFFGILHCAFEMNNERTSFLPASCQLVVALAAENALYETLF